jgi:hypothetical protein
MSEPDDWKPNAFSYSKRDSKTTTTDSGNGMAKNNPVVPQAIFAGRGMQDNNNRLLSI